MEIALDWLNNIFSYNVNGKNVSPDAFSISCLEYSSRKRATLLGIDSERTKTKTFNNCNISTITFYDV